MQNNHYDVLIIGTGAAGLGVALSLPANTSIALLSKGDLNTGASPRAQGGIAAVMNETDDIQSHIEDTLIAGAGLCELNTVEFTVKNAKDAIQWLIDQGVQFTKTDGNEFHLTKEGGHSHRRILHTADRTGTAVVKSLTEQILTKQNITCFTEHTAIDLLIQNNACVGASVLDNATHAVKVFYAKAVILATGGASSVYLHCTTPDPSTGDGIAMAYRAGCTIANMEFNQFHPTCLFHANSEPFLITEAIRGEGGKLRLPDGSLFMHHYDAREELAPRDVIARAIDSEMKKHKIDHVYLDMTHFSVEKIMTHFPTIYNKCLSLGIDASKAWIPVVPAAHYTCGGVKTDLQGRTNIPRLFAVGEVAYTGLHGANRMASNSLLECVVFAASCAQYLREHLKSFEKVESDFFVSEKKDEVNETVLRELILEIKKIMWGNVGIVRSNMSLAVANDLLNPINEEIKLLWGLCRINKTLIEARNIIDVARIIVECAMLRKESRGLHFNRDYPEVLKDKIITEVMVH